MRYVSTRAGAPPASFSEALSRGLAPDGGLYLSERLPSFDPASLAAERDLAELGRIVLEPFVEGDPLAGKLAGICRRAFHFPVPLKLLGRDTGVLELFHGPTAAFKDVGASFLAECLTVLHESDRRSRTVLVATSGDTGGAVAAAFFGKPDTDVVILFPKGRVSARQQAQLCAWGGNVRAFAVRGDFDDCQRMVKAAFSDRELQSNRVLLSANSINIGRLLPQTVYYAAASLQYVRERNTWPGVIVPSGNLGNGVAAVMARLMGFPIRAVVFATNANRPVPDFLASGVYKPYPTLATLANAMDVGDPSNMERLRALFPDIGSLRRELRAFSVGDEEIRATIAAGPASWGEIWCPHTAAAVKVREMLPDPHWIFAATAHPAKFETIVEPAIGRGVEVPRSLAKLLERPMRFEELDASPLALKSVL